MEVAHNTLKLYLLHLQSHSAFSIVSVKDCILNTLKLISCFSVETATVKYVIFRNFIMLLRLLLVKQLKHLRDITRPLAPPNNPNP